MTQLTTEKPRKIIDSFAEEIAQKKQRGKNPTTEVINFRNDLRNGHEREVWEVPTELLKFRKDNGRIASEVASYEKLNAPIEEDSEEAQELLRGFLDRKDPEKTQELMKSLEHVGQQEPAIITSDGFLINGNRRKLALDKLFNKTRNSEFKYMRVVILPGKDEEGGPPTLLEIEQIENRYQLQKEGKAEYYNFDRALSIRRKIDIGMSLEEQLRDDPLYANLSEKDFKKEADKVRKEYLEPLKCVDDYLEAIGCEGLYNLVSQGMSDREGRWQAFIDYNSNVERKLANEKQRIQMGLKDDEIGKAKDVAFKIIRQRVFPDVAKLHKLMRDYTKLLADPDAKKELFGLSHISMETPSSVEAKDKDKVWSEKNATDVIRQVKKAVRVVDYKKEKEEPIDVLEGVLSDLQQDSIKPENLSIIDLPSARKLAEDIRNIADDLKHKYWMLEKNHNPEDIKKKLQKKYKVS